MIMKTYNWLFRLLGLHDKEQKERTRAVTDYAERKGEEFARHMSKVKAQATRVQKSQMKVHQETVKLVSTIDDVTAQIMRATGGKLK